MRRQRLLSRARRRGLKPFGASNLGRGRLYKRLGNGERANGQAGVECRDMLSRPFRTAWAWAGRFQLRRASSHRRGLIGDEALRGVGLPAGSSESSSAGAAATRTRLRPAGRACRGPREGALEPEDRLFGRRPARRQAPTRGYADRGRGCGHRGRAQARRLARGPAAARVAQQPGTLRLSANRQPAGFGGRQCGRAGGPHADPAPARSRRRRRCASPSGW